ncbi:precorrin-3B synthase [Paraburkholderia acidisoli]|uniref:precorrin-3B synthase n=1 Tax=Paraburkholderia acidisoli TaxID=2571748 RepID=UPI0018EF17E7|nr:precorrin-3B synthase [Paraburkholderia acidisoli]
MKPDSTLTSAADAAIRPSACPGLVRVVAARDGGICRVRLPGGVLRAAAARALAAAALTHARGVLELTNRANVQIRGVRASEEAALSAALIAAGLGPHGLHGADTASTRAQTCVADELRNVMQSPLAGLDPHAHDTAPLAAALIDMLQGEPRFAALSPKFALLLDGGERLAERAHPHDIWLAALPREAEDAGQAHYALGLAGCPGETPLGTLAASDICATVRALLHAFLDFADNDSRIQRMRDIAATNAMNATNAMDALLERARGHAGFALAPYRRDEATRPRATATNAALRLGAHALQPDGSGYVGAQPALGRIEAATLNALATLAQTHGDGTLRVTPWQGLLMPNVSAQAMPAVLAAFDALGLVVTRAHPLARLIACAGSPGCAKSHADTKADAHRLAALLPHDANAAEVHLSGCERSCAAAHRATFTLLACAPGHYDLYRRDDVDEKAARFGRLVAPNLTIEAAAPLLARRTRSNTDV